MKAGFIAGAMLLATLPLHAQALWQLDFKSGKFPKTTTVSSYQGPEFSPERGFPYRHIAQGKAWSVDSFDGQFVALSPSHNGDFSTPVANRFTSPEITISDSETILRWKAISVLPGFQESYRVVVIADGEETEVFNTSSVEDQDWEHNVVSLSQWKGRIVQIAFECTSANKYLLAIGDIWAGVPEEPMMTAKLNVKRFAANGEWVYAVVEYKNLGKTFGIGNPVFEIVDDRDNIMGSFTTQQTRGLETIGWYPESDSWTDYTLRCRIGETVSELEKFSISTSTFERTLLVDEGTGTWCVNCPEGVLEMQELERTFGHQVAIVSTHTDDAFSRVNDQAAYWNRLNFYAVPWFKVNRDQNAAGQKVTMRQIQQVCSGETEGELGFEYMEESFPSWELTVHGWTRFASDIQNGNGRYGVGYTVTRTFRRNDINTLYNQKSNLSLPTARQYYFLPQTIPSDLAIYYDVNLSSEYGFKPVEGTIPAMVEADETYPFTLKIPLPEMPADTEFDGWRDIKIVAFILDTATGQIVNACKSELIIEDGVNDNLADTERSLRQLAGGWIQVEPTHDHEESRTLRIHDIAGRMLQQIKVPAEGLTICPAGTGIRIATLGTESLKLH